MRILYILRLFRKNSGFTLIELILVIAISSIIMLPTCSVLNLCIKTCSNGEQKDELILNGRHGIEYIKNEIKSADIVVSGDKIIDLNINYPTNIGFALVNIIDDNYQYITYYTKDGKLVRIACDFVKGKYPRAGHFKGHNEICNMIDNINNTEIDTENKMIYLDFDLKSNSDINCNLNFKSAIYIRCRTDF